MSAQERREINNLSDLISPDALQLLSASGNELVNHIGMDVVRGVVFDILTGRNLRDSTEALTRRRLAALNLATVDLFLHGSARSADFVEQLPNLIGSNSRIVELAAAINGTIIQMSAGYWPQQVAKELNRALGFQHELVDMDRSQIDAFLKRKLSEVPLEQFIGTNTFREPQSSAAGPISNLQSLITNLPFS